MVLAERLLLVLAVLLGYGALCLWQFRRGGSGRLQSVDSSVSAASMLVAYASQSGVALALAQRSAKALQAIGPVRVLPLNRVDDAVLAGTEHAFFVASTYGEGEPPDNGNRFARRYLNGNSAQFSHLKFSVLALGDSAYQHFCAFGHKLHEGLSSHGAAPVFAPLELDGNAEGNVDAVLQRWYQQLAHFGAESPLPDVAETASQGEQYRSWHLDYRQVVNVGSVGEPLVHLKFSPAQVSGDVALDTLWQAGDIAEVLPRNSVIRCAEFAATYKLDIEASLLIDGKACRLIDELQRRALPASDIAGPVAGDLDSVSAWVMSLPLLVKREYSIASVPEDGSLDLLVRVQGRDGIPGVASHWLGRHLAIGDSLALRVRSNPLFHAPESNIPVIFIGNGSGFAGIRAHLRARQLSNRKDNWLMFGERSPRADCIFSDEIAEWQDHGYLPHIDLTFSRCSDQAAYVQDAILANAADFKAWLSAGAAIYVCGSREGMAAGVDRQLRRVMGDQQLDDLADAGLYRRDVY